MNVTVDVAWPDGSQKRYSFTDPAELTIGRDPSCAIPIQAAAETVSSRHLRLTFEGRQVTAEDTKSANGVFIRGKRVQRSLVAPGDEIGLGQRGPKLKLSFVAPTVLETPPTVLEPVLVPPPSSTRTPSATSSRQPAESPAPGVALTRVGSKTVMMMIGQAIELAKKDNHFLAGGTVFVRELVRQTVQESNRRIRWALVAVAVVLVGLAGYVGYSQVRATRDARTASALLAERFKQTADRIRATAETQAAELQAVKQSYDAAQRELETKLASEQAARQVDQTKISALRAELVTTRSRADEIEKALDQTQGALKASKEESQVQMAALKADTRKELKARITEALAYIESQQKAYLTSTQVKDVSGGGVKAPVGMAFIPDAGTSLQMKKRIGLEPIRVTAETQRFGVSPQVAQASLRAILTEALSSSGRFEIEERTDLGGVLREKTLAAKGALDSNEAAASPLNAAQLLLSVDMTRLDQESHEHSSPGAGAIASMVLGAFGGLSTTGALHGTAQNVSQSINQANINISDTVTEVSVTASVGLAANIRDVLTGEVKTINAEAGSSSTAHGYSAVFSSAYTAAVAGGSVVKPNSPLGSALAACAIQLASKLNDIYKKAPWKGRVVTILDPTTVVLNAGSDAGVREGDTFKVSHRGQPLTDPATGRVLGYLSQPAGIVYAQKVEPGTSFCHVAEAQNQLARGDDAEYVGRTIAVNAGETPADVEQRIAREGSPAKFVRLASKGVKFYPVPSSDAPDAKFRVDSGLLLPVQAQFGGWLQVHTPDGRDLWMLATGGSMVNGKTFGAAVKVEAKEQKTEALRSAESGASRVARVNPGQNLEAVAYVDGWYEVRLPDGATGWIKESQLRRAGIAQSQT